ncbi:MAG: LysR family transcriptional regulator [Lysobacter sp.]|nr:LysR family transcriptional regulator [Lysobacter sp.]
MSRNEQHLEWNDLRLVLAIARGKTLAAAAEQLGSSHPTVLRQAAQLEKRMGVGLFERSRRGHALTAAGEEVVRVAERVEAEIEALERSIVGHDARPAGLIRLTTVDSLLSGPLTPMLAAFRRTYPEVTLEVASGRGMSDLSRRDADIAIRAGGQPPAHLAGRKLSRIAVGIYRARRSSRRPVVDFAAEAWVMPDDSLSHLASVRWLEARHLDRRAVLRADSLLTLAMAARSGIGMAILPCYLADVDPALVRVGAPIDELAGDLWLLAHPELTKVKRIRTFMDSMYEQILPLRPLFEGHEGRK